MSNRSDLDSVTVKDRYVGGSPVDTQVGSNLDPGGLGSAAYADTGDFATAAQGATADTAVQPGDLGTAAGEDVEFFVQTDRSGEATLVAGTVTVGETSVGSGTLVFLSRRDAGSGTAGFLTWSIDPGVGFTIDSDSGSDVSVVAWLLVG